MSANASLEPGDEGDGEKEKKPKFERSDDGSRDVEFDVGEEGEGNQLFEFVRKVPPPELVQRFSKAAPRIWSSCCTRAW